VTPRIAMKWGVIFAASVIAWTAAVHLIGFYTVRIEYADLVDRLATVLPLAAVTGALIEQRRALNGTLSFGRGVLIGAVVGAVSAPIIVAATWGYHHFINPEWLSILVTYQRQTSTANGMPAAQVAARIAQLQQSGGDQQQVIGGLVGTLVICLVVSLIMTPVLAIVGRMRRPADKP
jgi:hypothetical protein